MRSSCPRALSLFQEFNLDANPLRKRLGQLVLVDVHHAHYGPPVLRFFGITHGVLRLFVELECPRERLLFCHLRTSHRDSWTAWPDCSSISISGKQALLVRAS